MYLVVVGEQVPDVLLRPSQPSYRLSLSRLTVLVPLQENLHRVSVTTLQSRVWQRETFGEE